MMDNVPVHIDELISKFLAGEAGREETALLDAWRMESADNARYFEDSKRLLEAIAAAETGPEVDVDAAWNKLDARIGNEEARVIPLAKRFTFARMAAAVLLLVALAFVTKWIFTGDSVKPTTLLAGNTSREQKLPDGSKVFMNKNAELSYVVSGSKREVKLKGEAFFEVVHNAEQPFVIDVNGILIKDIGTAFNVKALPESNVIEVFVESGEVQFYSENTEGLTLLKGDKAIYNKSSGSFSKVAVEHNDNTMSYKSKVFNFNDATLQEVIEAVNAVYESDIRLASEDMAKCRLSVEFNKQSLDVIVSVIAETLDLEIEHKGSALILKGGACAN